MTSIEKTERIERVFFSRWLAGPVGDDVGFMEQKLALAQQQVGGKLLYAASVNQAAKVPNAEQRLKLNKLIHVTRRYCDHAYIILEGNDMQHNLIRAMVSGSLVLTRTFDEFVTVHKNADQVAAELTRQFKLDGPKLIQRARERGLVL
jgi:hypothetical protein